MTQTITLNPEELLAFGQEKAYWDGFSAGVKVASNHAQQAALQRVIGARKENNPTKAEKG